jgi:colanic acid biosynthesis glycosyl transferase WcaI
LFSVVDETPPAAYGTSMRVLIVTNLYEPDVAGGAQLTTDLAKGLKERGDDVTVFTSYPYFPEWKRKSQGNPWRITTETMDGVTVVRHGMYIPKNPSKLIPRLAYEASFFLSLSRSLFSRRYDAVIVYALHLAPVVFATMRRMVRWEPLWLNVQDISAEAATKSGLIGGSLVGRLAKGIQSFIFNRADLWSSLSPRMVDQLANYARRKQPLVCFPNWLHHSLADSIAQQPPKTTKQPGQPIKLLFSGNVGKKQGLVEACELLQATSVPFELKIQGAGGEGERLSQWIAGKQDARFSFSGLIPEPDLAQVLNKTDVCFISEKPGGSAAFLPSKLIPALASGTPVICLCEPDGPLGDEVREFGLGWIVEWGNAAEELPKLITRLSENPELVATAGAACKERSIVYSREYSISKAVTVLQGMIAPTK